MTSLLSVFVPEGPSARAAIIAGRGWSVPAVASEAVKSALSTTRGIVKWDCPGSSSGPSALSSRP